MFHLKENNTTPLREVVAGLTTFFAMAYVIFVIPGILVNAGTPDNPMPYGAVFLAVIIAAVTGTLVMALVANVPYALAPGIGLSSFFTYTVCASMGFTWQEGLSMVFLCGLINVLITVTNVRKIILRSIPENLQLAIGGGIGIFIAYVGIKNAGFLSFSGDPGSFIVEESGAMSADSSITPALANFDNAPILLAVIGMVILFVLLLRKVPGGILLAIVATTLLGIPMGVVELSGLGEAAGITDSLSQLGDTFLVVFSPAGLPALFSDPERVPIVLITVFSFSLSDTFDTIGMFLGTGRRSGIFTDEDMAALNQKGKTRTKLERALFADAAGTVIGSLFGATNTTTYLESTAGIGSGGRTGLASVVTAGLFLLSAFLAPVVALVPAQATAPVLIAVGIMMLSNFKDIGWDDLGEAIPAFFAAVFMALCYNISYGIATCFIFHCIVQICRGRIKEINPVLWITSALFLVNFALLAAV